MQDEEENGMVMQSELKPNELNFIISSLPYMYTVWKLCNLQLKLIQKSNSMNALNETLLSL